MKCVLVVQQYHSLVDIRTTLPHAHYSLACPHKALYNSPVLYQESFILLCGTFASSTALCCIRFYYYLGGARVLSYGRLPTCICVCDKEREGWNWCLIFRPPLILLYVIDSEYFVGANFCPKALFYQWKAINFSEFDTSGACGSGSTITYFPAFECPFFRMLRSKLAP